MASPVIPQYFQPGFRLVDGDILNKSLSADIVSSQDAITAASGGGTANATQLSTVINRVSVVAVSGDSVKLPASVPGSSITIDNDTANALAIFPSGSDLIEDLATAFILSAGQDVTFVCPASGKWYQAGSGSFLDALTAIGTTRASGLALQALQNNVTVAANGTGVVLPASSSGLIVTIYNNGLNAIKVYGAGADTIDGAAAATGVTLSNTKRCIYTCFTAGAWISAQLGATSA